MSPADVRSFLVRLRGTLLRHHPAVTLAVDETSDEAPESSDSISLSGEEAASPAAAIEAVARRVDAGGSIPRRVLMSGGPSIVVGSSLCEPSARERESLFGESEIGGRAGVVCGSVAVVTGGAQGFGEQIVHGLVRNGARVIIADLNEDGARDLSRRINEETGPVTAAVHVNVADEPSVEAAVDEIVRLAGGIDLFVANAGVLRAGSVKELPESDFDFVTKVNYKGFFLCAKHAARVMSEQNAAGPEDRFTDIVQINSKSGLAGSTKNGAYAGGKFGGIGLVQSFALELVADRIKVNAICPGNYFDGPLWSDPDGGLFFQYLRAGKVPGATSIADVKAYYEAQVPMRRGCDGEDVLRALLYVVEQRYETGQAVPVTGGQIMLS